ncbi:MAG: hypothetical protein WC759_03670 [Candidatus Micrarchaeia archaeon]|jgi:hypothetical protein
MPGKKAGKKQALLPLSKELSKWRGRLIDSKIAGVLNAGRTRICKYVDCYVAEVASPREDGLVEKIRASGKTQVEATDNLLKKLKAMKD